MIDHPLFNSDNPDDKERRKVNIAYINIRSCEPGKKKVTLTNQWEPEELQTPSDVLEAVGNVEGTYELVGRGTKNQVIDTQMITLRAVKSPAQTAAAAAAAAMAAAAIQQPPAQPQVPQPPALPLMQAGGIVIPSNMDPTMAMIISMMAFNSQQQAAASQLMMQVMQHNGTQLTTLIGTLATAFAPVLAGHGNGGAGAAPGATESGFLKGIEIMAALKEGVDGATKQGTTDWGAVTNNVMNAFQSLAQVAKATAGAPAPAAPVVPPGGPA
jgi:hypothetical protein